MVKRYDNVTLVRKTTSCADSTVIQTAPYGRYSQLGYTHCGGDGYHFSLCPQDWIGSWIAGGIGDLNGLSTRNVDGYTPDMVEIADTILKDHNYYRPTTTGETVGTRTCKKSGFRGVVAKKIWQGLLPFTDPEQCVATPSASPTQTLYRSLKCTFSFYAECKSGVEATLISHFTGSKKQTVNQTSGIVELVENNFTVESDTNTGSYDATTGQWTVDSGVTPASSLAADTVDCGGSGAYVFRCLYSPIDATKNGPAYISGVLAAVAPPKCSKVNAFDLHALVFQASQYTTVPSFDGPVFSVDTATHVAMTQHKPYSGTSDWACEAVLNDTTFTYTFSFVAALYGADTYDVTLSITWELSDPYTAVDLDADWKAAADSWDLSDWPLNGSLRTDAQMARLPLCCYDEVAGDLTTRITTMPSVMDDYNAPISDGTHAPWATGWTPTFEKIDWIDSQDYLWLFTVGGHEQFTQPGYVDGVQSWTAARIIGGGMANVGFPTHLRTGEIISHNNPGYDRHFWFGCDYQSRVTTSFGSANPYQWETQCYGHASEAYLPEVTMRWQPFLEAQIDTLAGSIASDANLPFFWKRQIGNTLVGVKQVNTKEVWPSANFARPYGKDLWAVDQATVCKFVAGGGGSLIITPTLGATAPVTGDWVMIEGYGVTQVTVIGDSMTPYGTPIPIPTGCDFPEMAAELDVDTTDYDGAGQTFCGKMRWWGKPPFGLLACAGVYDVGTDKTTFTIPATPYWTDLGSGITQSVDLYDADAGNGNPHNLITTVTLTKTNVGDLTATCDGDQMAAKYLIPHDMKPWWDDDTPKGDFVKVRWYFNTRQAALEAATSVSTVWLGGTTPGTGILGCTSYGAIDANIKFTPCCPVMVGGVAGSLEKFATQNLVTMPTLAADATYGTYYMGMIATTMTDPFWQAPFNPASEAGHFGWNQDNGSGQGDTSTNRYYPHAPMVEARASLPTNGGWSGTETAPALPSGVTLEYDTAHNVHLPPQWNGYNVEKGIQTAGSYTGPEGGAYTDCASDWGTYNAIRDNVNASGRFSSQYAKFIK